MYVCCLCQAFGEERPGKIRENERVPLCAVHRFELRCRRGGPQQPSEPLNPIVVMAGCASLIAAGSGETRTAS